MGDWYRVVKRIRGKPYIYLQRTRREGKRVRTQSKYLGRLDERPSQEGSLVSGIGLALFGLEDEYGERRDSLWNRYVAPEPNQPERPAADPASVKEPDVSSQEQKETPA